MSKNSLITMANEIAAFFVSENDPAEAPKSVAGHLKRYWAPRMRKQIIEYVTSSGGEGLVPAARAAVELLAAEQASR
jgi:formate dehydrogenase subunit delta